MRPWGLRRYTPRDKPTMNDAVVGRIVCHQCHAALDAGDAFCRHCGVPTVERGSSPSLRPPGIWESPVVVLPLLFLVLGPLALPLLWRSRRFTRVWKIIHTILVLGETVFLAWTAWFALQQAMASLQQLQQGLKGL